MINSLPLPNLLPLQKKKKKKTEKNKTKPCAFGNKKKNFVGKS